MSTQTLTRAAVPLDANWRLLGNCLDEDPDAMYPHERDRWGQEQAKAICHDCPVRLKCLTDAIKAEDWESIRGGMTGPERRAHQAMQATSEPAHPIRRRLRPGVADHHDTIAAMLRMPTPATWAQIGAAIGWSGEATRKYWDRQKLATTQQVRAKTEQREDYLHQINRRSHRPEWRQPGGLCGGCGKDDFAEMGEAA